MSESQALVPVGKAGEGPSKALVASGAGPVGPVVVGTASSSLVDALPYIDTGFDEAAKADAVALIEEECRTYRPTKNYLAHLAPPSLHAFLTPCLKAETERMAARQPMDMLSMKRYELPPPPPGKLNDLEAWKEAVNNSKAQLEHQRLRSLNLQLLQDYGSTAFTSHLQTMDKLVGAASTQLLGLRRELQNINYQRKEKQTEAGQYLRALESSWVRLVSKNYQIEQATAELDQELEPLRKRFRPTLEAEAAAAAVLAQPVNPHRLAKAPAPAPAAVQEEAMEAQEEEAQPPADDALSSSQDSDTLPDPLADAPAETPAQE